MEGKVLGEGGQLGGGGIEEGRKRWEGGIRENRGKGK